MTDNVTKLPIEGPEWKFAFSLRKQDGMYFIEPIEGMEDQWPSTFGAILDLNELESTLIGAKALEDASNE